MFTLFANITGELASILHAHRCDIRCAGQVLGNMAHATVDSEGRVQTFFPVGSFDRSYLISFYWSKYPQQKTRGNAIINTNDSIWAVSLI